MDSETTIASLKDWIRCFVDERDWRSFHNLKNLSMSLAIESAELMEHTQWLSTEQVESGSVLDRDAVVDELADVFSYTLAIANALDVDLTSALLGKLEKNRRKYPLGSERTRQGLPTNHPPTDQESL